MIQMGNANSSKFNILSNLPPELVLLIISYLHINDVAHCLLVCSRWHEVISYLSPYWISVAVRVIGLSKNAATRCASLSTFTSPRSFYIAAKKHKVKVKSMRFKYSMVDLQPSEEVLYTNYLSVRGNVLVRTQKVIDSDGQKMELVVEKLQRKNYGNVQSIASICTLPICQGPWSSGIVWAQVARGCLFWVTTDGVWNGHDLKADRRLFCWKEHLLRDGHGVCITCCDNCFLTVVAYWSPVSPSEKSHLSTCSLQIVKLGSRDGESTSEQILPWKSFQTNHNHRVFVNHDSRYWIRQGFVLSDSETKCDGVCDSHKIVLQSDCCTTIQRLQMPEAKLTDPKCIHCHYSLESRELRNVNQNSKVALSSDSQLMGMVFNRRLYVWKLKEQIATQLISSGSLTCVQMSNVVNLVALGHVYSVVAYLTGTHVMDYTLHVILTQTGETLIEYRRIEKFYNWSFCCQLDPLHRFDFLCDHDSEWLDDVQHSIPAMPLSTVHNHHGRVHLESVALSSDKPNLFQSWRRHWRCAINHAYRK